ncbi:hypothetical protein SAMN06265337_0684 [Hymenobacter gelipurpurascens]|uniref:Uncharacterized protein n=1 Tax=Hymenobacter gelipurpurascens TaxID=89968 RepID=A0A212T9L9_9BACT|nr:hypothetical protein [Hymenobacter gelipurpurascens]SNC62504.1 hypothetical protein SAMN06265337_0684 [Hymenobacter gelipurpurascens]
MNEFQEREIVKGYWLYDGLLKEGVIIKAIAYDYWYELEKSDGLDMADEQPELNAMGEMYMIEWTDHMHKIRESFTVGTLDLDSTKAVAEVVVNQRIDWV